MVGSIFNRLFKSTSDSGFMADVNIERLVEIGEIQLKLHRERRTLDDIRECEIGKEFIFINDNGELDFKLAFTLEEYETNLIHYKEHYKNQEGDEDLQDQIYKNITHLNYKIYYIKQKRDELRLMVGGFKQFESATLDEKLNMLYKLNVLNRNI